VLLLAAFCAVIVFFPPEGRVAGPLHEFLWVLLGGATFMLPLALAVVGFIQVLHTVRPDVPLPRRRFAGVAIIAIAVAASENLIASARAGTGTGLIGEWLSASLLDLFGGPLTTVLLADLLGSGIVLAFNVKWPKAPARPSTTDAES
jgi:chromate transport protein ChrA